MALVSTNSIARSACRAVTLFIVCMGMQFGVSAETAPAIPTAVTHDNLQSAGQLAGGVLSLRLEIREANWHPDADDGSALPVLAFAEEGNLPSVPGPLIRVPEGTRLHVTVTNMTLLPAFVHGLHQHPGGQKDTITLSRR